MEQLPAIITKARARLLVRAPFIGSIALGLAWVNAQFAGGSLGEGNRCISVGDRPDANNMTIRPASTDVLPEPAPASTNSVLSRSVSARSRAAVSRARRSAGETGADTVTEPPR